MTGRAHAVLVLLISLSAPSLASCGGDSVNYAVPDELCGSVPIDPDALAPLLAPGDDLDVVPNPTGQWRPEGEVTNCDISVDARMDMDITVHYRSEKLDPYRYPEIYAVVNDYVVEDEDPLDIREGEGIVWRTGAMMALHCNEDSEADGGEYVTVVLRVSTEDMGSDEERKQKIGEFALDYQEGLRKQQNCEI